jgi:hypothetical protein
MVDGMNDGVWIGIADGTGTTGTGGNRINQVLPSPFPTVSQSPHSWNNNAASICSAWTGGGVDQRRGEYLLVANGGHADYGGNEAYALSLREATPAWRRITTPTPTASMNAADLAGADDGLYGDGRPRSMHSTFACFGDERMWYTMMNSVCSADGGSAFRNISFNRGMLGAAATPAPYATNPWDDYDEWNPASGPTNIGTSGSAAIFGVSVFDRYRHKIWSFGGNAFGTGGHWSVDTIGPSRGTLLGFQNGNGGNWNGWAVCAHDLRICVVGEDTRNLEGDVVRQGIHVFKMDIAGEAGAWQLVTNVTGTGYFAGGSGGVYVARNRTIGIGNPVSLGRTIYRLQIPTTTVNGRIVYDPSGQWVWSNSTPPGPTMQIASGNSGAYSKWNIVEDMGDGRSAIVYVGDITGPTYVYKIPAAGL